MRVAIIDSGVGGLTVAEAVQRQLTEASYIYCSDNAHFPYGEKSENEVVTFTLKMAEAIQKKYRVDILVVACSTASTVVLEKLRTAFNIPIVGVVPAIKPAAEITKTKVIGLLATKGTVNRNYTQDLISKFASNCKVVCLGSSKLVQMAERKMSGEKISLEELRQEVGAFLSTPELDTVVLGCTHFPVLKKELEEISPRKMNWLEPGEAIARRVVELVKGKEFIQPKAESVFCYTKDTEEIRNLSESLKVRYGFTSSALL